MNYFTTYRAESRCTKHNIPEKEKPLCSSRSKSEAKSKMLQEKISKSLKRIWYIGERWKTNAEKAVLPGLNQKYRGNWWCQKYWWLHDSSKVQVFNELFVVIFIIPGIEIKMKTQKSLNHITLLIASGIVVNFGLFVINVNAYFTLTAKTFQGKGLAVVSFLHFMVVFRTYKLLYYSSQFSIFRSW